MVLTLTTTGLVIASPHHKISFHLCVNVLKLNSEMGWVSKLQNLEWAGKINKRSLSMKKRNLNPRTTTEGKQNCYPFKIFTYFSPSLVLVFSSVSVLQSLIPDIKVNQEAVVELHPEELQLSGDEESLDTTRGDQDKGLKIRRTVTQVRIK